MAAEIILPKGWEKPAAPYSHAVKKGNMVFVAGKVSHNEKGELVGEGDIKKQTRQTLENIRVCLDAAGATLEDVVSTTVYLPDVSNFGAMNEVYREFFSDHLPARATVTAGLVRKEYLVEISAVAVIG